MKYLLILCLSIQSFSAFAVNEWCGGIVKGAYINSAGGLVVKGQWRNGWTQLCNIDFAWKGVSVSVCKSWVAIANTAVVSESNVLLMYSKPSIGSCGEIPTYSNSPSPAYLMIHDGSI